MVSIISVCLTLVIQSLVGSLSSSSSSRSHLFAYANDQIQAVTKDIIAAADDDVKTLIITQTHRDFLYSYAYLFVFVFVAALAALNSVDLGYNREKEEERDDNGGVLVEDHRAEGDRPDAAAVATEKERSRSRYVTRSRSRMQDELSVSTRSSRRNRSPGYRYQGIVENPEYDSTIIR